MGSMSLQPTSCHLQPPSAGRAALEMLYSPREAAAPAARASLWLPLSILALAGAAAAYPMLLQLGPAGLVDAKLRTTPEGFTRSAILLFLALQFGAPFLLMLAAWTAGALMNAYLLFVLDARAQKSGVVRVTAYGLLPVAIAKFFASGLRLVSGPHANRFNPLASNLAFFFNSNETSVFWYEFAQGLDLFSAWAIAITVIGLSALTRQRALTLLPPLLLAWLAALAARAWLLS